MQVRANAQQYSPGADGQQMPFVQVVVSVNQVFHAITFAQKFTAIEGIDIKFLLAGLKTTNEITGQTNPRNGKLQSTSQQHVNQAEADWISRSPIDNAIQITVLRLVIIGFVSNKF